MIEKNWNQIEIEANITTRQWMVNKINNQMNNITDGDVKLILVNHRFNLAQEILELEKRVKSGKLYHVGQRFKYGGETYILASVGNNKVNLINKDDGRRYSVEGVKINDTRKITEKQMQQLVDAFLIAWKDFELVE